MIGYLLQDLRADSRWFVEHLKFNFTPSFSTVRQATLSKVWELLKVYSRLLALAFKHMRVDLLIYPSGGPQSVPMVRDVFLLPFVRLVTKRLWVQFHAAGIAERLKRKHGVLERLLKYAYASVDGAIVMTNYNRIDPEALGIGKIEVIPHCLDDENPYGKLPDFSSRPLKILHAGHLYGLKGTPQLIEAFSKVVSHFPESRLVLMGEFLPPYSEAVCRSRCRELGIQDKVEIVGVLGGGEKAAQFSSSHLFVFGSIAPYESFGLVMAEAMMWGLPMVVSEWRGNRDVTGEAAEYFDVTLSMESSLSAKLQQVLADRRTLETRAIKSRKRFVSAFRRQESEYRGLVARLVGAKSKA